ncbi:MAG: M24 family metallopeptidase [Planctomycetes bacterium]|nr:M24 family metallopeptidase [Planctomycetota bacterium]
MAAAHRAAFMAALGDGAALVRSGPERIRNRDTHFRFRPDSDFWWLTAFREPDAVLLLRPAADTERCVLFVRPRDPELETWNGRRAGVEGAVRDYGADAAFPIDQLDKELPRLLRGHERLLHAAGQDTGFDATLHALLRESHVKSRDGVRLPTQLVDLGSVLHELRLRKSPDELAVMRRAAALTAQAHLAAARATRPGAGEWEIEAEVEHAFRKGGGWGPGYPTIAAAGANATILHYTANGQRVREGEALLLDAGCEVDGYTADVTRCFPSGGRFTPAQRALYDVVLRAELAGIAQVRPGAAFHTVHETALRVLVEGLIDLGLLPQGVDAAIESGAYRRWYMHRTSHWLGLDVHDVGAYHTPAGTSRPLEPGMVLTVEPGLYVAADDERAPEALRGIGIRIEDDVLVTPQGHEVLTAAIPKQPSELEALR